jgi:hypothetical protein
MISSSIFIYTVLINKDSMPLLNYIVTSFTCKISRNIDRSLCFRARNWLYLVVDILVILVSSIMP